MKLNYKILWLDDKIEEFLEDEYDKELVAFLSGQGFDSTIDTVSTEAEFFDKLDDSYDLILTDYHLKEKEGETRDGDQIVKEVRTKSIYTEILFYTARADLKDTYKLDRITFVETHRSSGTHQQILIDRVRQLIDLTIKKFQHIVSMRGMIMQETSSLDANMLAIINRALDDDGKFDFDPLAEEVYDALLKQFQSKLKFVESCQKGKNFKKLTKDTFVYSANYKILTLSRILKILKREDFSDDYKNKIITVRNRFAHAVLEKNEDGIEFFKHGESGVEFNESLCEEIRKDINAQLANLSDLEKAF